MELVKKTTILLSPALHKRLTRLAKERGESLGQLVRSACEEKYVEVSRADRLRALEELRRMSAPVGTPGQMKRESVPEPGEALP